LRFSHEIADLFAAASRDFNPLHMSDLYARTTPFGQRVVHGACGILATCALFSPPAGHGPAAVRAAFHQPLFFNLDYEVRVSWPSANRAVVMVMDGTAEMTHMTVDFRPDPPPVVTLPENPDGPEFTALGHYSPSASSYATLLDRLHVDRSAWGDALPITLLGTSYLTGMKLPGERALLFRLSAEFSGGSLALPAALDQELMSVDRRWDIVKSRFCFSSRDSVWSSGEMQAFQRPARPGLEHAANSVAPDLIPGFAGKIAVVAGASRGFGAAIALTLASAGAMVVALYAQSSADADHLQAAAEGLPGRILPTQCDASETAACRAIRQEVQTRYGRLDWLICSAAPPLQGLRIEPAACERIESFLRYGFALALAPLAAFLDLLSDHAGRVLVVSSSAVEDPPASWPHYIALKSAVEGLVRAAAAGYPKVSFCIARPGRLLTDLVNTPAGRSKAENPAAAAVRVLSEAVTAARPGEVCYIK